MKIRPYSRIVVEGMDGSGKTTLVKQLEEYLGDRGHFVPGYNRVKTDKPPMQQWWMEQLAENPINQIVVHDRFFYPELVYGPVLRGRMNMDPSTRSYVQNYLRLHGFLIYCRPPTSVVSREVHKEDQMKGVIEKFHDLLIKYDRVMIDEAPFYNGRFAKYDWTATSGLTDLLKRLTLYIYE
jgi:thymidylate kinase